MASKQIKSFRFSPESIKQLEEISRFHNRSQANMLEVLIQNESAKIKRLGRVIAVETIREIKDDCRSR